MSNIQNKSEVVKMKRVLGLMSLFLLFVGPLHADRIGQVADFTAVSSFSVVGISPSSWTLISSAAVTTFPMREKIWPSAYFLDLAPQAASNSLIAFTTATVAPNTTWYGYTYKPSDVPWILSFESNVYIWGISVDTVQQILFQQLR